ncbi:hypothetical protein L7F22_067915 [Adiantum nelumboides]|nr:hypothetical protein [Adiantum nelumboides]
MDESRVTVIRSTELMCHLLLADWAILSTRPSEVGGLMKKANLVFLHLDPTMEESLGYSVESLIGTSALDLVHPSEAKRIEMSILQHIFENGSESRMLRCTMKSVLSVGKYVHSSLNDRKLDFSSFAQSKEEDHQLTDIRMELIGDEMMLCFFHAVDDRSKQDHNQKDKTHWSNWCETTLDAFDEQHCQTLWEHILAARLIDPSSSAIERHQNGFPVKVFQILANSPQGTILFSWPPPRLFESMQYCTSTFDTDTYGDGSYFADEFARLTDQANLEESYLENSQRPTACKSRLQAAASIHMDGFALDLYVRVIPHGEIKFALFLIQRAEYSLEHQPDRSRKDETPSLDQQMYPSAVHQNRGSSFAWAPRSGQEHQRESSTQQFRPSQALWMNDAKFKTNNIQAGSPVGANKVPIFSPMTEASTAETQGAGQRSEENQDSHLAADRRQTRFSTMRCTACGTSKSPEWRKGPDGKKSLCNACGLRFQRDTKKALRNGE